MHQPTAYTATLTTIADLEQRLLAAPADQRTDIEARIANERALLPSRAVFLAPVAEYGQPGWYHVGQAPTSAPFASPANALAAARTALS